VRLEVSPEGARIGCGDLYLPDSAVSNCQAAISDYASADLLPEISTQLDFYPSWMPIAMAAVVAGADFLRHVPVLDTSAQTSARDKLRSRISLRIHHTGKLCADVRFACVAVNQLPNLTRKACSCSGSYASHS
jgi:hypothetical protein